MRAPLRDWIYGAGGFAIGLWYAYTTPGGHAPYTASPGAYVDVVACVSAAYPAGTDGYMATGLAYTNGAVGNRTY